MNLPLRSRHLPLVSLRATALVAMLLITVTINRAQTTFVTPPAAPDAKRYAVQGTVLNSLTGEPIARALVSMDGQSQQMAMTDANGVFRFQSVPEGQITLGAERPGFFPASNRTRLLSVTADVDSAVVELVPQASINGRVASLQNVPIQDLPVRLYRRMFVNGRARWQTAGLTNSDDDGQFRFGSLEAGSYSLSVGPENWQQRAPGSKPHGYTQVFYPSAPDFMSAGTLSVSAGQQVEADFSLTQEPFFEISGQVAGVPPGMEPAVQLVNSAGEAIAVQQAHPAQHDFTAYVPAGRYTLKAFASSETLSLQGATPLTVAGNTAGIQVMLGQRAVIPVNVHAESSGNSGQEQPLPNVSVMLVPSSGTSGAPQLWARPVAGRRGSLEIEGAEPATYSVEINAYAKYAVSATSGSTDLLHDDLTVSADGRAEPIEIVLGSDGGEITGSVRLSDHASDAAVLLVPERGAAGQVKAATVQSSGEFQFQQVRPGEYSLFAIDRGDDLEYQNPDVLNGYLSNATRISVAPRQKTTATIDLISAEK
jgi:hypothetical protein